MATSFSERLTSFGNNTAQQFGYTPNLSNKLATEPHKQLVDKHIDTFLKGFGYKYD